MLATQIFIVLCSLFIIELLKLLNQISEDFNSIIQKMNSKCLNELENLLNVEF